VIIPSRRRGLAAACGASAAIGGAIGALHYHQLGLTLSHYDARGHLVVARRIIDSITPGWQQIGAVWLPLPHLLSAVPVQLDEMYRSGAAAVVVSVAAFALSAAAIAWIVAAITESTLAGAVGAVVFALNPNVVYLQATPMTEPLLIALTTAAIALLVDWTAGAEQAPLFREPAVGAVFALACLTRYESWPVTVAALGLAAWARWRRGDPWSEALRGVSRMALYPAAAIVLFVIFSRIVVGQWFVSSGFFVPENKALGDPMLAAAEIWWGARTLSGSVTIVIALCGLAAVAAAGLVRRAGASTLIPLSLAAAAALPWAAFVKGHPFRIRYMIPLLALEAIGAGALVGLIPRFRRVAAIAVLCVAAYELRPFDAKAPMVVEAQWEQPNAAPRRRVTEYLRATYSGDTIMASMGSLGHYMQEASHEGFAIRDFLHEGNGDLWLAALEGPRPFVGWVLVEEKANGGDMLAKRARENPHFLDGFSRVCEGGGLALYQRQKRTLTMNR
jgi:hypothetical protein